MAGKSPTHCSIAPALLQLSIQSSTEISLVTLNLLLLLKFVFWVWWLLGLIYLVVVVILAGKYFTFGGVLGPYPVVLRSYSDQLGCQGLNLGWLQVRQTPYLLYYHSRPSNCFVIALRIPNSRALRLSEGSNFWHCNLVSAKQVLYSWVIWAPLLFIPTSSFPNFILMPRSDRVTCLKPDGTLK